MFRIGELYTEAFPLNRGTTGSFTPGIAFLRRQGDCIGFVIPMLDFPLHLRLNARFRSGWAENGMPCRSND